MHLLVYDVVGGYKLSVYKNRKNYKINYSKLKE